MAILTINFSWPNIVTTVTATYCTIQNFGGMKFWQNSLHLKLADTILANAQNY